MAALTTAALIARLQAEVSELKRVDGSADLGAAKGQARVTPSAWVLPSTEIAGQNTLGANAVSQRIEGTFSILIAVKNYKGDGGAAGHDALQAVRTAIKTALLGWQPTGVNDVMTFARGGIIAYTEATLWWQDQYRISWLERAT